ncbi:MAG TPA: helicase C-terminal domain-containing protein [Terriglobales bacterium]|nr:helicase C-terminal domain-containing protein [Terriglobales bacterium]
MKSGFLKKLVIIGKNNSIPEEDSVEFSAIKLIDLKMEEKSDFQFDLKRPRFKDIQALEIFLAGCSIVVFGQEKWIEILDKIQIQSEQVLDLEEISKILFPRLKNFKLGTIAEYFDLNPVSDKEAEAVHHLLPAFLYRLRNISPAVFQQLMALSFGSKSSWGRFLIESRKIELIDFIPPGENDKLLLNFNPTRGEKEIGSKIEYSNVLLPKEGVLEYYQNGGPISSQMDKFEQREEQKVMAQGVASAYNEGNFLLVEAGAGVGKSLAYLVPALLWSNKNKDRTIISTNTKNLQEQLFFKDIPLLEKALTFEFKVTLLKGKKNYLCLYRLYNLINRAESELPLEDQKSLSNLAVWAAETTSGDIAENSGFDLSQNGSLWNKVCCEGSSCLNQECPHYQKCFYLRVKKEAQKSHLLVVNHSLFFSEVLGEGRTLSAGNLILDEAHNLENAATQFLGKEVSFWKIKETLDRLYHRRMEAEWGVLAEIKLALQRSPLKKMDKSWIEEKLRKAIEESGKTYKSSEEFFKNVPSNLNGFSSDDYLKLRYKKDDKIVPLLNEESEKLVSSLKRLNDKLEIMKTGLEELRSSELEGKREIVSQLETGMTEIQDLIDSSQILFSAEDEGYVYWIECPLQKESPDCKLCMAPLEVGESLNELIYENLRTAIFTSATLSVNGDFSYIKERLGLNLVDEERVKTLCLGSTFSFEKQARVLVPSFVPSPKSEGYLEVTKELIEECGTRFKKNILALFTSHEMLDRVYSSLKSGFRDEGIVFLAQGKDGQSTNLFERFKGEKGAVLLGTSSFWEGVDAPGKALEILILVKLPFAVPTEPLAAARMERLEALGKNPFMTYSLPEAVIKFKQGFGRLIRKKDDYGLVIILDSRVLTQRYGRVFLDSLPVKSLTVKNKKELTEQISTWFEKEKKLIHIKN